MLSEDSNIEIAAAIGRTPGVQMLAWSKNAFSTAKYGLEDFK